MSDTNSEVVSSIDQLLPKRWALSVIDGDGLGRYVSIASVLDFGNESGERDEEADLFTEDQGQAYTWLSLSAALAYKAKLALNVLPELYSLGAVELPHSIHHISRVLHNANARYKKALEAAEIARREAVLIEDAQRDELMRLTNEGRIRHVGATELSQHDVIMDFGDGGIKERVITKTELIVNVTFADGTSEQYDCHATERFYVRQR